MAAIKLITETEQVLVDLDDSDISKQILKNVPLSSRVNVWGKEIYFSIPDITVPVSKETTDVSIGDVAFWVEGNCLCVFFGRTPISISDKPLPASGVVIIGTVTEGIQNIVNIGDGETISVKKD